MGRSEGLAPFVVCGFVARATNVLSSVYIVFICFNERFNL